MRAEYYQMEFSQNRMWLFCRNYLVVDHWFVLKGRSNNLKQNFLLRLDGLQGYLLSNKHVAKCMVNHFFDESNRYIILEFLSLPNTIMIKNLVYLHNFYNHIHLFCNPSYFHRNHTLSRNLCRLHFHQSSILRICTSCIS